MLYKHLFGPISSRRFGISLGVDMIPYKTCSLNCVYCECGLTTNLTLERKEYFIDEIIVELNDFLISKPEIDYITLTGSGEPTLNAGINKIVQFLKKNYKEYKIALLTNGTLLWDDNLKKELLDIDLIKISFDAANIDEFIKINRPHKDLDLNKIIQGIIDFKKYYHGKIWIEIFIVENINDSINHLNKLKELLLDLKPDKIQLNTLDRNGAEQWVAPVDINKLKYISKLFNPVIIEIISRNNNIIENKKINILSEDELKEKILSLLKRRSATFNDLLISTNQNNEVLKKILENLIFDKIIEKITINNNEFFKII